jgi:uncharacterized membrane protein YkvA (DUF1232 family)
MSYWWTVTVGMVGGLLLLWLALVVALFLLGRHYEDPTRMRDVLRLIPDIVRLLHRLARDPTLPRGVRIRLGALLVYLALPIDLIPDFIPVIGYADDVVIVALALRSVAKASGGAVIDRHWPGTPQGLLAVKQLAGLST